MGINKRTNKWIIFVLTSKMTFLIHLEHGIGKMDHILVNNFMKKSSKINLRRLEHLV